MAFGPAPFEPLVSESLAPSSDSLAAEVFEDEELLEDILFSNEAPFLVWRGCLTAVVGTRSGSGSGEVITALGGPPVAGSSKVRSLTFLLAFAIKGHFLNRNTQSRFELLLAVS